MSEEKENRQEQDRPRAPSFAEFFSGLAGEVLIHLGYIENPFKGGKVVNLDLARYTLEIMAMLEEKTRGNLSDEEKGYIEAVLADLRLRYVDAVKQAQSPDGGDGSGETREGESEGA